MAPTTTQNTTGIDDNLQKPEVHNVPDVHKIHWGEKSYSAGRFMVNLAYYSGVIPIYWDKKNIRYEITRSKLALLRWWLTVLYTLAMNIFILVGYMRNAKRLEFNFKKDYNILGIQATSGSMIMNSVILHLNTLFKVQDIKSFFNTWVGFYESFRDKSLVKNSSTKYAKYDIRCARILLMFFTQFHSATVFVSAIYLARCNANVLTPWIPTACQENDARRHVVEYIPAFSLFQSSVSFLLVNSCMIYLHFLPIFVTQGFVVHKEMRSLLHDESKLSQKKQLSQFYSNYRSLQILISEFNQCVAFISPAHILYLVIVCGLVLYYLLGMKFGPVETIASIGFLLVMAVYVSIVCGTLSQIEFMTKELLKKAKNLASTQKYLVKVNESCRPLKIWIGGFGPAPRDIVVMWGLTTLDFTITLYLM